MKDMKIKTAYVHLAKIMLDNQLEFHPILVPMANKHGT